MTTCTLNFRINSLQAEEIKQNEDLFVGVFEKLFSRLTKQICPEKGWVNDVVGKFTKFD